MKTIFRAIGLLIGLVGISAVWLHAQQPPPTPMLATPSATPSFLLFNTPTEVTITLPIPDSNLISTGINVIQTSPNGSQTILGQLHDDGQNGDQVANDGIYSIRLPFAVTSATRISLDVSAAFRGILKRVLSPTITLAVGTSAPELPPDPGPSGMTTLNGIDIDGDGVRDDVQRYIAITYSDSGQMQSALTQLAAAQLALIRNATNAGLAPLYALEQGYALECLSGSDATKLNVTLQALENQIQNTPARVAAYLQAEGNAETTFAYTLSSRPQSRCLVSPSAFPN